MSADARVLLAWVAGYYTRDNRYSYAYRQCIFDAFLCNKVEFARQAIMT